MAAIINSFRGQYNWLSNFEYIEEGIHFDGMSYETVEHAFQAAKTLDPVERKMIQEQPTPGLAKQAGRKVTLRPNWDEIKIDIMVELLWQKFQLPEFAELLLRTGDAELIEGNEWNDTIWGVCNGVGQNLLGKLLMAIRTKLRGGQTNG